MGHNDHIGLTIDESLSGWIGKGRTDPVDGRMQGEVEGTSLVMRSHITIASLSRFLEQPDHACKLEGTISYRPLGQDMVMREGVFNVFVIDPRTGERQMVYETCFTASDGETYFFRGVKHIHDDPGFDPVEDMTTLFTTIYKGDNDRGPVFGAGQLFFKLGDLPGFVGSIDVTGGASFGQAMRARIAFMSFAYGQMRDAYLHDVNPVYTATYQNVVLSGEVVENGTAEPFFLVSGIHTPNFPWGDEETFCDVLLVIGDPDHSAKKYAITARRLTAQEVDVRRGVLRYDGPIFDVTDFDAVSFSEMN
ncbi:MAG: hypothetical protein ACOC1F_08400, partial [Myxococcota bacterium]